MSSAYRVLTATELEGLTDPSDEFAFDVLTGLAESPKRLPSRYFYDDRGSEIFQQIMGLKEYYLTGCEEEILNRHGEAILAATGAGPLSVVDMGAGDGKKTLLLLDRLAAAGRPCHYMPIDISEGAMGGLTQLVEGRYRDIGVEGVVSEYFKGLQWLGLQARSRGTESADATRLVLFLGSNIGNLDRPRARTFLRRLWTGLASGDHVLIGFDLKKDIELLLDAYNDSSGVTASFNLNLMSRINSELGGQFEVDRFRHFSTYNVFSGAMESYLVSLDRQEVRIDRLQSSFSFRAWEPIHTEYSYKYLLADIERLASESGFEVVEHFGDERGFFVDSLWRVEKG
jgi:dimethylhistidine N-methyltransferase